MEAEGPSRKEGGKIMKNEGKWGKRDRSTFFVGGKGDSSEMMAPDPLLSLLLLKKGAAASGGRSLTKEPLMV